MVTQIYTKREAAEKLKVCQRTIDNLITRGKLNCTKIGRKRMFTDAHLNEVIRNREV
jgi:excisionase family DNA binding protein